MGVAGSSEVWLGQYGLGVQACYEAIMSDGRCSKDYFTYVPRGDKNCGCKESFGSLNIRALGTADYYIVNSQAPPRLPS